MTTTLSEKHQHLARGFPSLSYFVASDPDDGAFVFRRFDSLSARNLLFLQSEIADLEAEQTQLDAEDVERRDHTESASRQDWAVFVDRAKDVTSPFHHREKRRMQLAKRIQKKLREYKEALLQEAQLRALRRPSKQTHKAFQDHFKNVGVAFGPYSTLLGNSETLYDDRQDLVALARNTEEDALSQFFSKYCWFPFKTSNDLKSRSLVYLSNPRISRTVTVVQTLLAAVFLFGAIYNLYYVRSDEKRLAIIAGYTIAFSVCVGCFTKAKKAETFAACAAYAAVLVVFVAGDIGNGDFIEKLVAKLAEERKKGQ